MIPSTRTIPAVYENGVLRPLEPLELPEHSRVDVTIAGPSSTEPALGGPLNGCVGTLPAADAAELTAIVEREFEQVDPRDW